MKKLVTSSEAAQILGLSLQGIHYRIKKNQLESVKKDGKTFVYIDDSNLNKSNSTSQNKKSTDQTDSLIEVKNEQIELLKKTIKFLKKQKDKEIERLEKNQKKIFDVFQSEVELLKSAFNEMRNLYSIEHKKVIEEKQQTQENSQKKENIDFNIQFLSVKEFFIFMKRHNKTDTQIKQIILQKVKDGDKRFIYNKDKKEMLIYKSDFLDLL